RLDSADAGRDGRADPIALVCDVDAGVGLRLARGRHDDLREAVHPPRLLPVDPVARVEILELAREVDGVVGVVETGDLTRAGFAREQVRPRRIDVVADRRDSAETGDDDPAPAVAVA